MESAASGDEGLSSAGEATQRGCLREFLMFTLHQLISTVGVMIFSGVLCTNVVAFLHSWDPALHVRRASWVLTEVPGFPLQVLIGLVGGFLIGTVTKARALLLVWIIPLLFLCFGAFFVVHPASSIFAHLFGDACQPSRRCFDQTAFTLPFLASLSYAVGAALGRLKNSHRLDGR